MKLKFKSDTTLSVVESFDETTETAVTTQESFKAGETVEADIIDAGHGHVDLQFGDGSVAHYVFRDIFEEIP